MGGTDWQRKRCRERLERLSTSTLDCESIQREAIADIQRLIGFDRWCWPIADPETLLPLGGAAEHDYGPQLARALELEYSGGDFAAKDVLGRRARLAGSLSAETGGDLALSPRWDEVMRGVGMGDVAVVTCRDALGCWGWAEAYRDGGDRPFGEEDIEFFAGAGSSLGAALRRGLGSCDANWRGCVRAERDRSACAQRRSACGQRDRWRPGLGRRLPASRSFASWGMLPAVVYPLAARVRAGRALAQARALDRLPDGRWVMVEAVPLEGRAEGEIAITLRDATAREMFHRRSHIYGLSQREREVVAAVLAGSDTRAVTERLFISAHTVQDHLKSVFEKMSIHSRREMLAMFNASQDRR